MHSLVNFPTIFLTSGDQINTSGHHLSDGTGIPGLCWSFQVSYQILQRHMRNNVRHETHHEEWPGLNSLWYVIRFERWQINWFRNASSVRGWPVSNKKKSILKCKLILWFKYRNSWFECVNWLPWSIKAVRDIQYLPRSLWEIRQYMYIKNKMSYLTGSEVLR